MASYTFGVNFCSLTSTTDILNAYDIIVVSASTTHDGTNWLGSLEMHFTLFRGGRSFFILIVKEQAVAVVVKTARTVRTALREQVFFVFWQVVWSKILVDTAESGCWRPLQCCRTISRMRVFIKTKSMAVRPCGSSRSGSAPVESGSRTAACFPAYTAT